MSHATGKIEVVGLDDSYIYMRRYRAPEPGDTGEFIIARRNDEGYWFDDFEIVSVYDLGARKTSEEAGIKAVTDSGVKILSF